MNVEEAREAFMARGLSVSDVDRDPLRQFDAWFREAESVGLYQPHAMVVATADADGRPSARFVLLRGHDSSGFRFFSDSTSAKGRDLEVNGRAALLFPWHHLSRQVRVEGAVAAVAPEEADDYWATRPRGSQVAATASQQSAPVADRAALDDRYAAVEAELEGREVPRPERWSGFRVVPDRFEFWQGREDRFHDRVLYTRARDGEWERQRLQP